jgi:hypothetical protein
MVLKNKKGQMTFDVETARMAKGTKLEEIKAGDRVGVIFIEKEGKSIAVAIAKPPARPKTEKKANDSCKGDGVVPASPERK